MKKSEYEELLRLLLKYSDEYAYESLHITIFKLKMHMGHRDCRACGGFRPVYKDDFCSKECLEKYHSKKGDIFRIEDKDKLT